MEEKKKGPWLQTTSQPVTTAEPDYCWTWKERQEFLVLKWKETHVKYQQDVTTQKQQHVITHNQRHNYVLAKETR